MGGALLAPGIAWSAVTESDFLSEMPVVLSVSRLLQPVSEAPAAVTIIDQDMIRTSGFRDIPDLLRLVPGFSVAYTRNNTWAAGYHGLGDAYSRRFQVLVDGRSIYSPHYGAVNWTDLPLSIDDIERIEVIRGPNASTYGANAFSAVINIITKTSAQVAGESVSMQFGERDMRGVTVRHGGGDKDVRYRITASAQQRDRFENDVTGPPGQGVSLGKYLEASKTYFVNGRMDWQLSPKSNLMAQFGLSQGNWNTGAQTSDPRMALEPTEQDSRALYVQLAYRKVESEQREWRVQISHTQNRFDADAEVTPLIFKGINYGNVVVDQYLLQSRSSIDLQVNEQLSTKLRAVWGGELWQESVKSPQNYNSGKTLQGEIARAYGNLEWRAHPRVLLQGGAMLEHHYFTGTDVSPRVAVNFTAVPDHVIRLGVSRAYRSPTFFEEKGNRVYLLDSGAPIDIDTIPSNGLRPEQIVSQEIGYVGQFRSLRFELDMRLYRDKIDDFIGQIRVVPNPAFDMNSFQRKVFTAANIGKVAARGGELQIRWRPVQAFDMSVQYARVTLATDTSDKNLNSDIPLSAPRNSWGGLARYRFGSGWEVSVFAQHSGTQKWLTEGDTTRAFTRIDARLARRWNWNGAQVEAALSGQNLGSDYEEFRNTNRFGQRVYGSLAFNW